MAMDSSEFANHLQRVSKDMMRIAEGAEAAADHDIEGAERASAIDRARAKLAEYENSLSAISAASKVLEAQYVKQFAFHVEMLRESLETIDKDSQAGNES
jgi:hypothetical protein